MATKNSVHHPLQSDAMRTLLRSRGFGGEDVVRAPMGTSEGRMMLAGFLWTACCFALGFEVCRFALGFTMCCVTLGFAECCFALGFTVCCFALGFKVCCFALGFKVCCFALGFAVCFALGAICHQSEWPRISRGRFADAWANGDKKNECEQALNRRTMFIDRRVCAWPLGFTSPNKTQPVKASSN
jgi:hypothetical protein